MADWLIDLAALAAVGFVVWVVTTRWHILFDAAACWGSC